MNDDQFKKLVIEKLEKLDVIQADQATMKADITTIKSEQSGMRGDISGIKTEQVSMKETEQQHFEATTEVLTEIATELTEHKDDSDRRHEETQDAIRSLSWQISQVAMRQDQARR